MVIDTRHTDNGALDVDIKVDFRLRNSDSAAVSLAGTGFVYTIHDQATPAQFHSEIWWFSCGSASDVQVSVLAPDPSSDLRQVQFAFSNGSIPVGGDCQVQSRVYKDAWVPFDENDDPSYTGNREYTENTTLYLQNIYSPLAPTSSSSTVTPVESIAPNTVLLNGVNQDSVAALAFGTTITMTGFPTDYEPTTLSLHFVPEPNMTMDCELELDNKLFSLKGYYDVIHIPFQRRSAIVAKLHGCNESSPTATVRYWLDNSNQETTPLAQLRPNNSTLAANTWLTIPAGGEWRTVVQVPEGQYLYVEMDRSLQASQAAVAIDGSQIIAGLDKTELTSDLWAAGEHLIRILPGASGVQVRWQAKAKASIPTVVIPAIKLGTAAGGEIWQYNWAGVPHIQATQGQVTVMAGDLLNNVAPVVTVVSRPAYLPWVRPGQYALGNQYQITAQVQPGKHFAFAIPLPDDPALNSVQHFAVQLESTTAGTWTWLPVDSISNGMVWFTTEHFSTVTLMSLPGPIVHIPVQGPVPRGPVEVPTNTPLSNLDLITPVNYKNPFIDNTPEVTLVATEPDMSVQQAAYTSNAFFKGLVDNELQSARNATLYPLPTATLAPWPFGTVPLSLSKKDTLVDHTAKNLNILLADALYSKYTGAVRLHSAASMASWLNFDFFFHDVLHAFDRYESCRSDWAAAICVSALQNIQDQQGYFEYEGKDGALLNAGAILRRGYLLCWLDPSFRSQYEGKLLALEAEVKTYMQLAGPFYRKNNVVLKIESAIALGAMLRAHVKREAGASYGAWTDPAPSLWFLPVNTNSLAYLMNESSQAYLMNESSQAYLNLLSDSKRLFGSDGEYAEGVDYLDYLNEDLLTLIPLGLRLGMIDPKLVPDWYKKSGEWLLNLLAETGSAPNVDDGIAGAKPWIAPYALINQNPVYRNIQEWYLKQGESAVFPISVTPERVLTYPVEITGTARWVTKPVLGGVGTVSYHRDDGQVVSMRMIAETEDMRIAGEGHDQQDNTSVTMNWYDPNGSGGAGSSYDLILDPGYAGYANRDVMAGYDVHNTLQFFPNGGTVSSVNGNAYASEADILALVPKRLQKVLSDADFLVSVLKVVSGSNPNLKLCMHFDCSSPSGQLLSGLASSLQNAGGGSIVYPLTSLAGNLPSGFSGITTVMLYNVGTFGSNANIRTVFQWEGDFFVIDQVRTPPGSGVFQHWNLPITWDVLERLNPLNANPQSMWSLSAGTTKALAYADLRTALTEYPNYDPPIGAETGKVWMHTDWFSSGNAKTHMHTGAYQLKEDEPGRWVQDPLLARSGFLSTTRVDHGFTTQKIWESLVSVFQPRLPAERASTTRWIQKMDCTEALCMERTMPSGAVRVVYVRRQGQMPGTIPFPGKHSPFTVTDQKGAIELGTDGTVISQWVEP